jgi:hypothetical protein
MSENLKKQRQAMMVIPPGYKASSSVQENIQRVAESNSTAPYVYMQLLSGTYYNDDARMCERLGLEEREFPTKEVEKLIWENFFNVVGPIEKWKSQDLLRMTLGINPDFLKFFLAMELSIRARDELIRRIQSAPDVFSRKFMEPLISRARVQNDAAPLPRIVSLWSRRHLCNRIKAVDEDPVSPDSTADNDLTEEEKTFVRIFAKMPEAVFIPQIHQIHIEGKEYGVDMGGDVWMEAVHMASITAHNVGIQRPCTRSIPDLYTFGEKGFEIVSAVFRVHFPATVKLTHLFSIQTEEADQQYFKYELQDQREPTLPSVIVLQPPRIHYIEPVVVEPRWEQANRDVCKTLEEAMKFYSRPVDKRTWDWKMQDQSTQWSLWSHSCGEIDKEVRRQRQEEDEEDRKEIQSEHQRQKEIIQKVSMIKWQYGLSDCIRIEVSDRQLNEIGISLGWKKYPNEIIYNIFCHLRLLVGSSRAEDRVITAIEEDGAGHYKREDLASKSLEKLVSTVQQNEIVVFKRSRTGEYVLLDGEEDGFTNVYFAVRQKDTGLVAWISKNSPSSPKKMGCLLRVVGYYQESTPRAIFPNGLSWKNWTVFYLEGGTIMRPERKTVLWFTCIGGPKILHVPFIHSKRYELPSDTHNEFGEMVVENDRILWTPYHVLDSTLAREQKSYVLSELVGGANSVLVNKKRKKGTQNKKRKKAKLVAT